MNDKKKVALIAMVLSIIVAIISAILLIRTDDEQ